jgi:hypothetical protein
MHLGMASGLFVQTETVIHELGHTGIHEAVVDMATVPLRVEYPHVHESTKLVRHGLGLHVYGLSEIPHTGVVHPDERM